jgi:hypothetical protein
MPRHLSVWRLTPLVAVPVVAGSLMLVYDLVVDGVLSLLVGDLDERERQIAEAIADFLSDDSEV